jgi:hypothetical protein
MVSEQFLKMTIAQSNEGRLWEFEAAKPLPLV